MPYRLCRARLPRRAAPAVSDYSAARYLQNAPVFPQSDGSVAPYKMLFVSHGASGEPQFVMPAPYKMPPVSPQRVRRTAVRYASALQLSIIY